MTDPDNQSSSLWPFAIKVYGNPPISHQCLQLQDRHGINVNMMLWCLWMGTEDYPLGVSQIRDAERRIDSVDTHYVKPLRQMRRRLKLEYGDTDQEITVLRDAVKNAELLAEKKILQVLETFGTALITKKRSESPTPLGHHSSLPIDNLRRYLRSHHMDEPDVLAAFLEWNTTAT